jgi:hypothetical protein
MAVAIYWPPHGASDVAWSSTTMPPLIFGDYEVKCILRGTAKLVVSFAGIGDLAIDAPEYEWMESLTYWNSEHSYIFIKDNSRSWYTSQNGINELCLWLRKFILEVRYAKTIAFGLSMGGYGAIIADSTVHFDLVITMSSRVFVGADALFDPRLANLSSNVPALANNNSLNLIRSAGTYIYLYSIDDPCDMMHAVRLFGARKPNIRMFKTRGQHNIGLNIKKTSSLNLFFDWIFTNCETGYFQFEPFTRIDFEIATALERLGHPSDFSYDIYNALFSRFPVESIPRVILDNFLHHSMDRAIDSFEPIAFSTEMTCTEHAEVYQLPLVAYCHLGPEEFARNLKFGWSDFEGNGCWAVGKWHCIQGHVIGLKTTQNALLIEYDVYLPTGTSQALKFYLNNRDTLILEVNHKNDERSGVVAIPFSQRFLSVLIETPNFTSPQVNGLSEDNRNLSLFVKSLSIISASVENQHNVN